MNTVLAELKAAAMKCTRCGACLQVCPVHKKELTEASCARGRLFLLRSLADGKVEAGDILDKLVNLCTLCGACEAKCPSGVKTNELFLEFRKKMADAGMLPQAKRVAFTGLKYRRLFDTCMRLGPLFQNLVLKPAPDGKGKVARFPLPAAGLTKRRIIPSLAPKPLRSLVADRKKSAQGTAKNREKVAFFPGCMINYIYPQNGMDIIGILEANNVEVVIPNGIGCCGTPVFTSGDFATARDLAENNIRELEAQGVSTIITACATCGSALMKEYGHILEDGPVKDMWLKMREKVRDITQFLAARESNAPSSLGRANLREVPMTITYHDPCHLVRGMNVAKEPRELLKAIPGIQFREMTEADSCCGCAGTFSATNYPLSRKINDTKLDNAQKTGAEAIVTGCSACRMHMLDGLSQRGSSMQVLHTVEILARAYGLRRE